MGATIPDSIDELTPLWLTDALRSGGAIPLTASVETVRAQTIGVGVGILGQLARLELTYNTPGIGPASIVAKLASPYAETKDIARFYGFYRTEVSCYRQAMSGDGIGVRMPTIYGAEVSDDDGHFYVLLEDLSACRVADQIEGVSLTDAGYVIDMLARLHARWWQNPDLDALTWLRPVNNPAFCAGEQQFQAVWPGFLERYGEVLSASSVAVAERFSHQVADTYHWLVANRPMTMGHNDLRLDNLFFDHPDGAPVVLIDWQLSVRSIAAQDLSYFLTQSMRTEDRREFGDELLRRWHRGLVDGGVNDYSLDAAREDYRRGILLQLSISVVGSSMEAGNERGRRLLDTMVARNFAAVDDEQVGELLLR